MKRFWEEPMQECDKRFDCLYREYAPRIQRFIKSKVWCEETAADLMQDTFIRFQQAQHTTLVTDASAYLFRIARNIVVDHIRSVNAKHAPKELVEISEVHDLADKSPCMEHMAVVRSDIQQTMDALSLLSQPCQRIFWLSRLYGYKNSEIAEQEGVCLSTVEKNLSKALKHCRSEVALQAA